MFTESSPLANTEQCRICLEDERPDNMIYPCQCAGTNKYVHDKCLKNWIILTDNSDFKTKCPTCHYKYKMIIPYINEDPIKCNVFYDYLATNFWKSVMMNQALLFFFSLLICLIDIKNATYDPYPTYPLYNATQPFITTITEFQTAPFFVYYSFTCTLYTVTWILIILLNITLLKNSSIIYLKKLNPCVIIVSPIAFALSIYLNMLSFIIGTLILTKLVQFWVRHHLHTIHLIKQVRGFHISNYSPV